jgi:hypothetical protein
MSSDALNRIRQKKRPAVPPRNETAESSSSQDTPITSNQDTNTTRSLDTKTSRYQESKALKTKASTLRLEQSIATELTLLCKQQGISREVLVEAMFLYCENHPGVLESVLEQAQARHLQRQEISNRKRAETMMKRFSDET